MIILTKNLDELKGSDLVELQCTACGGSFFEKKYLVLAPSNRKTDYMYCRPECRAAAHTQPRVDVVCLNCTKPFQKSPTEARRSPNHFCCRSCAATYRNTHKTQGSRRSKLEEWIEAQLRTLYPDLAIEFNTKTAIGSELDIYIPSLRLAFELNGIFHYEPIFGQDKLDKIKEGDQNKFFHCQRQNISLCVINASQQINIRTDKKRRPYLDIITNIINSKLNE